jgi:hypothetical protein
MSISRVRHRDGKPIADDMCTWATEIETNGTEYLYSRRYTRLFPEQMLDGVRGMFKGDTLEIVVGD